MEKRVKLSRTKFPQNHPDWSELKNIMERLKAENKALAAKCSKQEEKVKQLENQNCDLKTNIKGWLAFNEINNSKQNL